MKNDSVNKQSIESLVEVASKLYITLPLQYHVINFDVFWMSLQDYMEFRIIIFCSEMVKIISRYCHFSYLSLYSIVTKS